VSQDCRIDSKSTRSSAWCRCEEDSVLCQENVSRRCSLQTINRRQGVDLGVRLLKIQDAAMEGRAIADTQKEPAGGGSPCGGGMSQAM